MTNQIATTEEKQNAANAIRAKVKELDALINDAKEKGLSAYLSNRGGLAKTVYLSITETIEYPGEEDQTTSLTDVFDEMTSMQDCKEA